jgi:ribosome biogenesis protein BMS1
MVMSLVLMILDNFSAPYLSVNSRSKTDFLVSDFSASESADKEEEDDDAKDIGGLFKLPKKVNKKPKGSVDGIDSTKHHLVDVQDWDVDEVMESIKDCFVTGKWNKSEDAQTLLEADGRYSDHSD